MTQPSLSIRSHDEPDERRAALLEQVAETTVGETKITRITAEPGWRWSDVFRVPSCDVAHTLIYVLSGRMHIRMDDGTDGEATAGDFFYCPPGHDSWVVGDEPLVFMDIKPAHVVMDMKPAEQ